MFFFLFEGGGGGLGGGLSPNIGVLHCDTFWILFGFLGSYSNNLFLKGLYFFLGCTPNQGSSW